MRVIRCKPGEAPEICEIDNTLEALQAEVGGYIEHVQLAPGVGLLISRGDTVLRAPRGALLLDAGRNVPGQVQYVRYVIPDAAAQGEEVLRKGVRGLKVSDWHRRITPGMERAMEELV